MPVRKGLQVAIREYLERVRTKTFWISILCFPLIMGVSLAVPFLLNEAREARRFAIVDQSGWLFDQVEEAIYASDMRAVFSGLLHMREWDQKAYQAQPEFLRSLVDAYAMLDIRERGQMLWALMQNGNDALEELLGLPEAALKVADAARDNLRGWWVGLTAEQAGRISSGISKVRYIQVPVQLGKSEDARQQLNGMIESEKIFAYFVIGPDPVASSEGCEYVSNNFTDEGLKEWLGGIASQIVRARRIEQEGILPAVAQRIQEPLQFGSQKITARGEAQRVDIKDTVQQWAPLAFVYLLWISVLIISQMLLTSTIEEKSNRIMEVLLSSLSPLQIMAGKIGGIAATGLTVVGSWVFFLAAGFLILPSLNPTFAMLDLGGVVAHPLYLGSFVIYFLFGYLFYAAVLVGIGSAYNSLHEAQALMTPVTLVLMIPLLTMMPITQDPNGLLARVLSFVPPFTPFVMMNRAAGPPELWEYVATTLLMIASVVGALWAAAKIFRVGILMTGKPPKVMEILRWIRQRGPESRGS